MRFCDSPIVRYCSQDSRLRLRFEVCPCLQAVVCIALIITMTVVVLGRAQDDEQTDDVEGSRAFEIVHIEEATDAE